MISGAQPCRPSLWLSSECVGVTNLSGYGEWAAAASQGDLFSLPGEGDALLKSIPTALQSSRSLSIEHGSRREPVHQCWSVIP